ncbi:glutaredoxin family protein [candidate division KSB1 bacterium]|nr:glutaredoxin family protein [candidate division KSB1 bacterium]NIR69398.1 glutaredoxin family protein [candidate division KSB1 bacterium]NIS22748.1 glutaredoxin family protein [candidate division KSB1 bacterium]NIT69594.1 glutaredoxin family protein [candidate division KSB1 bacterium]NIU23256.1 glutaredoxin family protein [candidate division KSB1 bacterium]
MKVELYSKEECHLCDEVKAVLLRTQKELPFDIVEVDIARNQKLFDEFKEQIPVVFIEGRKAFKYRVDETELQRKLKRVLQSTKL